MVGRILDWFFFWRHKQLPPPEKPVLELESPSGISSTGTQAQEPIVQEGLVEVNLPSTDVKTVMVVGAPTTRALELVGPTAIARLAGSVESTAQRASYFTHGCYAVARPGRPRLTAPALYPYRKNAGQR